MDFILCSAAFVIGLAVQVSCQLPPKPIGEWHPDRYTMYPNPWVNSSACKMQEPSGLCDVNGILTDEEKKSLIEQRELDVPEVNNGNYDSKHRRLQAVDDGDRCLCNINCRAEMRITIIVAIMKKIGPQITDYRAAAKDFAEKFRPFWNLINCSVIVIASKGDNMCLLDAGSDVNDLLTANETKQIDQDINDKYCSNGSFVDGIHATLIKYRNALAVAAKAAEAAAQTTASTPESEARWGSPAIIAGVIATLLLAGIVGSTVAGIRFKKKADEAKAAEVEHLKSTPKDVTDGQNEAKAAEVEHLKSAPRDVMEGQNAYV